MRMLNRIAALSMLGLVAVAGGGCSTPFGEKLSAAASAISGATVSPQAVIIASNSFDAVEVTATNYLRLKRCSSTSGPICRSPAATKQIVPAVKAGRQARDQLQAFMAAHPNELGPQGLYDALVSSVSTIQDIFTTYNVGAVTP